MPQLFVILFVVLVVVIIQINSGESGLKATAIAVAIVLVIVAIFGTEMQTLGYPCGIDYIEKNSRYIARNVYQEKSGKYLVLFENEKGKLRTYEMSRAVQVGKTYGLFWNSLEKNLIELQP